MVRFSKAVIGSEWSQIQAFNIAPSWARLIDQRIHERCVSYLGIRLVKSYIGYPAHDDAGQVTIGKGVIAAEGCPPDGTHLTCEESNGRT